MRQMFVLACAVAALAAGCSNAETLQPPSRHRRQVRPPNRTVRQRTPVEEFVTSR
jgi:hypothetical protein